MELSRRHIFALGGFTLFCIVVALSTVSKIREDYANFEKNPEYTLTFVADRQGSDLRINAKSFRVVDLYGKVRHDLKVQGLPRVYLRQEGSEHYLGAFSYG